MYKLKQIPEDFVVKEVSNVKIGDKGKYLYFKLSKREENTLDAVKQLSRELHLPEKNIGVAGNKDRNALTEQVCSLLGADKERLLKIKLDKIKIVFLGYGDVSVCLGDLEGNQFIIVVRNLETKTNITPLHYVPNYFDEQRFSENNMEIGRSLVKKDFKKAAELVDDYHGRDWLQEHPQDYVGALKKVTMRMLRMYVNAYQSYLWNETLARYLRLKSKKIHEVDYSEGKLIFIEDTDQFKELKIPIIGFGSEDLIKDVEIGQLIDVIMKEEDLSYSHFVIKQIPELTLEGEERAAFVEVKDLKVGKLEEDELNSGKKKVKLSFTLGKGSYATMVVKNLFY